jgi:hypothetical protein
MADIGRQDCGIYRLIDTILEIAGKNDEKARTDDSDQHAIICGQDSPGAPVVEVARGDTPAVEMLHQIAADHEEDVDAEEAGIETGEAQVKQKHREHCYPAEYLDIGTVFPALCDRLHGGRHRRTMAINQSGPAAAIQLGRTT